MRSVNLSSVSMKVWMGAVVILLSVTLLLARTLADMAPKLNVLPQIFSQDAMTFDEFVSATNLNSGWCSLLDKDYSPQAEDLKANLRLRCDEDNLNNLGMARPFEEMDLVDEMLMRFFIENWHTYIPDLRELTYRYGQRGPVGRLSVPAVFRQFSKKMAGFGEELKEKAQNTSTKAIDILRVTRSDNTFTVDFDIINFDGKSKSSGGRWRAVARITHSPNYRQFGSDFANPYGFVVTYYKEDPLKK